MAPVGATGVLLVVSAWVVVFVLLVEALARRQTLALQIEVLAQRPALVLLIEALAWCLAR